MKRKLPESGLGVRQPTLIATILHENVQIDNCERLRDALIQFNVDLILILIYFNSGSISDISQYECLFREGRDLDEMKQFWFYEDQTALSLNPDQFEKLSQRVCQGG